MRCYVSLVCVALLAACSYSSDGGNDGTYSCSNRDQKALVRDVVKDWYLWNDLLPEKVKLGDYDSPEELLASLIQVQPLDNYSYIGSAAADAAFFGAGRYEGFGFSWRQVAADDARLTRVFSNSPAAVAGFARGQRIVALDGRSVAEIEAAEGISAALDAATISFTLREIDGVTEFTVSVTEDIVTIDPVPQSRLIPTAGGTPVGYLEFAAFINTADSTLDAIFANFREYRGFDSRRDIREFPRQQCDRCDCRSALQRRRAGEHSGVIR